MAVTFIIFSYDEVWAEIRIYQLPGDKRIFFCGGDDTHLESGIV